MFIELEDVKNASIVKIESDTVMGRAGGDNDFEVNDPSVSGRHARIFQEGGRWYLEDLGSSNGTFVKGSKITSPVELAQGVKFSLCRHVFNVLEVGGETSEQPTAIFDGGATTADNWDEGAAESGPEPMEAVRTKPARPRDRPDAPSYDRAPGKPSKAPRGEPTSTEQVDRKKDKGKAPARAAAAADGDKATPPSTDESLVPYLLKTVPKAIGYYLAAIPLMLFNPMGTVRKGIEEMRFEAFGWKEIMAWAIPPLAIQQFLTAIATIAITIVMGGFSVGGLIGPLIGIFIAPPIGGIIMGFIAHPLLRFFVHKLFGGQTDAVTRTNYFLMTLVFMPIQGLAGFVGALLGLVPVPFIGILPILITMAAGLISLFITYSWFQFFQVKKWVMYVLLVFMVLSVVGNALGMIGVIRAGVSQLTSDSPSDAVEAATGAAGDAAAMVEAQIEAARKAGTLTPEVEKMLRSQAEAAKQAANAAANAAEDAAEAAEEAAEAAKGAAKGAATAKTAPAPAAKGGAAEAAESAEAEEAAPKGGGAKISYAEYQQRLAAVEAALEKDPTLVRKPAVKKLYTELKEREFKISGKYKAKGKKGTAEAAADAAVKDKLKDAEIYEQTADLVIKLHALVGK